MCPESIFFPGWAWSCLPFQHLLCPLNKQHAALVNVWISSSSPSLFLRWTEWLCSSFLLMCVFFTKLFISSSPFVPAQPPRGHVLGWRGLRGVGWSYRGCGGKPREVLLFLMCCRSPTQSPTSTSTSTPHHHQPPPHTLHPSPRAPINHPVSPAMHTHTHTHTRFVAADTPPPLHIYTVQQNKQINNVAGHCQTTAG